MTTSPGRRAIAATALMLAVVSGCATDGDGPNAGVTSPPSSSSPTASSPTPTTTSPTPTPPSAAEVAAKAAADLVRRYYALRDRLRQDPSLPLSKLESIATGTELKAQQRLFKRERARGLHQTGATEIVELTVQSVSLDNSDPAAGRGPTVQVDACYDVSNVDIVNQRGESVVSPDRPDTGWIRYFVVNYDWENNPSGGWRVVSSQDLEKPPCAPS